jgi:hypothetical protein
MDPAEVDGRGDKREGGGDGFVVIEQERRHCAAGREPVAAALTDVAIDWVAELAKPIDVAANGATGDAQPSCELGS